MCQMSIPLSHYTWTGGFCHFLSGDCSSNGAAVAGEFRSRCACSAGWTGPCCKRRRPWGTWGDPHLETLDGEPVLRARKIDLRSKLIFFNLIMAFLVSSQESSTITLALVNFGAVNLSSMTLEYSSATSPTRARHWQEAWLLRRGWVCCQSWLSKQPTLKSFPNYGKGGILVELNLSNLLILK